MEWVKRAQTGSSAWRSIPDSGAGTCFDTSLLTLKEEVAEREMDLEPSQTSWDSDSF